MHLKHNHKVRQRLTAKLAGLLVLFRGIPASVMAAHITLQMSPLHFAQVFLG